MKTQRLAAMLLMLGASLSAGQSATAQKTTVTVCMEPDPLVLMGVRPLASAMFASIGVKIDWRERDSCPAGAGAIQVHLSHDSTMVRDSRAEALAFARPYAGTVVVFLDRVEKANRNRGSSIMAYVLVHEITHVLEGISRHSSTGIMKAQLDYRDFEMYRNRPFADEDVHLIYAGLKIPRVAPAAVGTRATIAGQ